MEKLQLVEQFLRVFPFSTQRAKGDQEQSVELLVKDLDLSGGPKAEAEAKAFIHGLLSDFYYWIADKTPHGEKVENHISREVYIQKWNSIIEEGVKRLE